uniref:CDT1 domain-containing protein n=1 Tax=Parastrongyloides trichosuri TaxID=131310 RepID=A0A0N4Z054_PARTI
MSDQSKKCTKKIDSSETVKAPDMISHTVEIEMKPADKNKILNFISHLFSALNISSSSFYKIEKSQDCISIKTSKDKNSVESETKMVIVDNKKKDIKENNGYPGLFSRKGSTIFMSQQTKIIQIEKNRDIFCMYNEREFYSIIGLPKVEFLSWTKIEATKMLNYIEKNNTNNTLLEFPKEISVLLNNGTFMEKVDNNDLGFYLKKIFTCVIYFYSMKFSRFICNTEFRRDILRIHTFIKYNLYEYTKKAEIVKKEYGASLNNNKEVNQLLIKKEKKRKDNIRNDNVSLQRYLDLPDSVFKNLFHLNEETVVRTILRNLNISANN